MIDLRVGNEAYGLCVKMNCVYNCLISCYSSPNGTGTLLPSPVCSTPSPSPSLSVRSPAHIDVVSPPPSRTGVCTQSWSSQLLESSSLYLSSGLLFKADCWLSREKFSVEHVTNNDFI